MMNSKNKRQPAILPVGLFLALILMLVFPMSARALTAEEKQIASAPGWYSLPGGKYTYITKASIPAIGFIKVKKFWYHFDQNGYLSLGWIKENGNRYYAALRRHVAAIRKGEFRNLEDGDVSHFAQIAVNAMFLYVLETKMEDK